MEKQEEKLNIEERVRLLLHGIYADHGLAISSIDATWYNITGESTTAVEAIQIAAKAVRRGR